MYIITNRAVSERKAGFDAFGEKANPLGPHELRFVEVQRRNGAYVVRTLPDKLSRPEKQSLGLPVSKVAYRGKLVAHEMYKKMQTEERNLLVFVHGFNNDIEAAVERAFLLQEAYGVEVLTFSWPANGGGISGVLDYKSDKKAARASIGAFDRVLDGVRKHLGEMRENEVSKIRTEAEQRFETDAEKRNEFITRTTADICRVRVSLMCHSMGNYLFKQLLKSSLYDADKLLFDNIVLVAADTNNKDHKDWVDRVEFRNRLYVTINEKDSALRVSRMKSGDAQLARLGHFPYDLNASRAVYANFTDADSVGDSHAYFEGDPAHNVAVRDFFNKVLNGESAEDDLKYNVPRNFYTFGA